MRVFSHRGEEEGKRFPYYGGGIEYLTIFDSEAAMMLTIVAADMKAEGATNGKVTSRSISGFFYIYRINIKYSCKNKYYTPTHRPTAYE